MLVRSEFALEFDLPQQVAITGLLRLHPSLDPRVRAPEELRVEALDGDKAIPIAVDDYVDLFGNRGSRFLGPRGRLRVSGSSLTEIDGVPDPICVEARQHEIEDLPAEVLPFLLSSRYCEVDTLSLIASELFGHTTPGWARAIWIRDWVHNHVRFDYATARPTKTALDVFTERVGVCRDFQHLAVTFCRAMNLPARYVTGHLGDIRRPTRAAGDFSAWYEVFLEGRWWTMDARHNDGRMGRVLMAVGRDATDVAMTTSYGIADLKSFYVDSFEVDEHGARVPFQPSYPAEESSSTSA
jgi:transglutaminase-like putative cysteine protease